MNGIRTLLESLFPLSGWKAGVVVILSQVLASVLVNSMSYSTLEKFRHHLKPMAWEKNGKTYEKLFRVREWKDYVPSISAFDKKNLSSTPDASYLSRFILESVRAELCHSFAVVFGLLILLLTPHQTARRVLLWTIVMNVPCIIIQRYNRPRFERIINRPRQDGTSGIVCFWADETERLRNPGRM